jgi:hypothetical protein
MLTERGLGRRGGFSVASRVPKAHALAMNSRLCSLVLVLLLSLTTVRGAEITAPVPGSPFQKTILDDLRAAEPTASIQKEKKQNIVFDDVKIRVAGDWIWFSVTPRTEDKKWRSEPLAGLMHHIRGHWRVVAYVDEKVSASGKPKAYGAWRTDLLKKNPECPPELVPVKR